MLEIMNIGIDIDGVLTDDDEYILSSTSKYCYENNIEGFTNPYNYEYNKLNWTQEIIDSYRSKYFEEYVDNEPPRKFASEVIKKLKNDGHKIFIITARYRSLDNTEAGEDMRFRIKRWLDKNEIVYDKLLFAETPKLKEINENKIDIMIEDSPTTIPDIVGATKVFCFDARYNQNLKFNNMIRVFSWYDIYRKVKELEVKG